MVCRVVLSVVVTFSCVVPEVCKGMMLALWLFSRKAVLSFGNEELSWYKSNWCSRFKKETPCKHPCGQDTIPRGKRVGFQPELKNCEEGKHSWLASYWSPWSWFNPDVRHSFQHGQTAHNVNSGDETEFGGHLHVLRHESKLVVKASVRGLGRSKVESNDFLGKHNKHPLSRKRV